MGPYTLMVNLSQWTAKFGGPKIKVKANGPGQTTCLKGLSNEPVALLWNSLSALQTTVRKATVIKFL